MEKREFFEVRVDENNKFTPCKYRKVSCEELDKMLEFFGARVLRICSTGNKGAMAMWACFKSRINGGCYSDMINAYELLSADNESLVSREHELRHAWKQYEELWQIRHFGSVENYHLKKAEEARKEYEEYKEE